MYRYISKYIYILTQPVMHMIPSTHVYIYIMYICKTDIAMHILHIQLGFLYVNIIYNLQIYLTYLAGNFVKQINRYRTHGNPLKHPSNSVETATRMKGSQWVLNNTKPSSNFKHYMHLAIIDSNHW